MRALFHQPKNLWALSNPVQKISSSSAGIKICSKNPFAPPSLSCPSRTT